MNDDNVSRWVLQPDICRCCLSDSGTWDLNAEYVTLDGKKEKFADILLHCFGISLSFLNKMEYSQLVCNLCVKLIRDASNFHEQVLRADECFSKYWSNKNDEGKSNALIENRDTEGSTVGGQFYRDSDTSLNTELKSDKISVKKLNSDILKENRRDHMETIDNISYDSDTPIAMLKTCPMDIDNVEKIKESAPVPKRNLKKNEKQISERKRVILTCRIVLLETTACPFRHHKSWFQCFFCTEDFMEITTLREHISQSHPDVEAELKKIKRYPRSLQLEISNLECRHCSTPLIDIDKMAAHFVGEHNKVIYKECIADYKINSSPYTCHICKKEFHVFRTLTTHINEHYTNFICDVCGKPFMNTKRLIVHKRTHERGTFPCTECGKVLKTKTSQTNHIEAAHTNRTIRCHMCLKPMKHYNDRVKHMSEVHNVTNRFKCTFCDRVFNIKHYLATHVRQTHGNKDKKCTVCNMTFISNHSLKKHMCKHTGERPYTCSVCGKSYARNYTLREHMRVHGNDKKFLDSK